MKHLILVFILFPSAVIWSQETTPPKAIEPVHVQTKMVHGETIKSTAVNEPIHLEVGKSAIEKEKTVEYYESYISSLEGKIALIKENPEEDAKAKESGWYDEMEANIVNAKIANESLKQSEKLENK